MRIPVVFAPVQAGPGDVLLVEGEAFTAAAAHAPGCACCGARSQAGRALAGLLHDRARGRTAYFSRVVAVCSSEAGRLAVQAALAGDPVASACFREAGAPA